MARVVGNSISIPAMKLHPHISSAFIALAVFAFAPTVRAESAFDEAPTPLRTQSPVYPDSLRRDGISGMVSISATIDENGAVVSTTVTKSTNSGFDSAALAAVANWKFKPAKKGGQAVAVTVVLPVRFSISQ